MEADVSGSPGCTHDQAAARAFERPVKFAISDRVGVCAMSSSPIVGGAVLCFLVARAGCASPQTPTVNAAPTLPLASVRFEQAESVPLGHGYSRLGAYIYFGGVRIDQAGQGTLRGFERHLGRRVKPARGVDAASFVPLSEEYSRDKNTVYYKWISPGRFWVVEIPGADPATFTVMDFNLAKDAKSVWRTDVPIEGADAATARVVNPGWVWKDRVAVYYQFTRLEGAEPGSFRHLDQGFYRDAKAAYWCTTRLDGADVNTFRTFGKDVPFAADARHVWCADRRLDGIDAGSFKLVHSPVFADKNGVYFGARSLPVVGADPVAFRKVAELASGGCVLFRDNAREYLFDPYYGEVYTLTRAAGSALVAKPVWFGDEVGPVRHAANVSATWKDGALSEPGVEMRPGFELGPRPTWEVGKMQRMTDAIRETMTLPERASGRIQEAGQISQGSR
jgi:hypothetical protein